MSEESRIQKIKYPKHSEFISLLTDLVEGAEKLLVDCVICLKRHAKNEAKQCPSCCSEAKIRKMIAKTKRVIEENE